ncbi:MAG: peptidoglycan-binding protein [Christensenellaceae bacterium]|jgi:peptidoglycan hydrolase-like protein with peptidoglycan-binding domain|nr:peptidoglycan-binding protein [Christensenellaceae bacterium]
MNDNSPVNPRPLRRRQRQQQPKGLRQKLLARFPAYEKWLQPKALIALGLGFFLLITVPITVLAVNGSRNRAADAQTQGYSNLSGEGALPSFTPVPPPEPSPTPSPSPSPTPEPHPSNMVLQKGIDAPVIIEIQARLMELGYMEADEPISSFGPMTEEAIRHFQRQHSLAEDGKIGMETYTLLMSDQATKYTVFLGADGTDVSELQSRLRELGFMDDVTGHFGEATESAVKRFQQLNGLTDDGKVGARTREALYADNAKANYHKFGEKSEEVKSYQSLLNKLGYLTTTPDGNYGADTTAAVKRFQELNGLIPDGFLGYTTIKTLKSSGAAPNALQLGMKGSDVERVQKRLKELGYTKNVTGYFGEITQEAVKAFQKRNSLGTDGVVGRVTMAKLISSSAKKPASSSSGSSGTPSVPSEGSGSGVDKLISVAESKIGSKYVFASKGPNTFDCSGFVYYCLNQAGVRIGYMTSASWQHTDRFQRISSMSDLKRGDILSFEGHVGIYIGGGKMIDASSSQGKVRTTSGITSSSYWTSHFVCGYRVF